MTTFSVVSQNVQVCKGKEEESTVHNTAILNERSEKVVNVDNQFFAAPSLNHDNNGGRNLEIHSIALTP